MCLQGLLNMPPASCRFIPSTALFSAVTRAKRNIYSFTLLLLRVLPVVESIICTELTYKAQLKVHLKG